MSYANYYNQGMQTGGGRPRQQQQPVYTTRRGVGPGSQQVPTGVGTMDFQPGGQGTTYGGGYGLGGGQGGGFAEASLDFDFGQQQPQYSAAPQPSVTGRGAWSPNSIGTPTSAMDVMGNMTPSFGGSGGYGGGYGGGYSAGGYSGAPQMSPEQTFWARANQKRNRFTPWEGQTPQMQKDYGQYTRPRYSTPMNMVTG